MSEKTTMSDESKIESRSCCGPVKIALGFAAAWAVVIGVIWIGTRSVDEEWSLAIFLGRFHLLVVHIPIGLLFVALVAEFCRAIGPLRSFSQNVTPMLWFGALGAAAATILGFFFMVGEQEAGETMEWHFWSGLGVAALSFVVLTLKLVKAPRAIYMATLTATVGLTGYSAHLGGSLVHGPDFLAEHAPNALKPLLGGEIPEEVEVVDPNQINIDELVIYNDLLQPIFNEKCVECHGADKVKGDLRMDSFEELAKGGDIGEEFVPGNPQDSELIYRVTEADDDEIMPPGKDDVPMTEEEIALLSFWIEKGASPTMTVAEAEPTPEIRAMIEGLVLGATEPEEEPITLWSALSPEEQATRIAEARKAAEEIGCSLMPLSAEDGRLKLDVINVAGEFGDEQLLRLKPVASNIAWLDLGDSQVTDESLKLIGRMPELERLHLEKTAVTDAGLAHLAGLTNLEYLNLYETKITDAGLAPLHGLPKLRKLYLWQTAVTIQGKRDFERAVNLEINIGSEGEEETVEEPAPKPVEEPPAPAAAQAQ